MLDFDAATHTRLLADVTLDFDPTGTTVEVMVDGAWHAAIWLDSPVQCRENTWEQTAQTVEYFAGPEVLPTNGVLLTSTPRHRTKTRVTKGEDAIVADSSVIAVV